MSTLMKRLGALLALAMALPQASCGSQVEAAIYGKSLGANSSSPSLDWWSQRAAHAAYLLNSNFTQVDTPKRFDYSTVVPVLGGASAPVIDHTKSGVVYKVNNGLLSDMPAAGATVVANPMAESWYVARWVNYASTTLSGAALWPIHFVGDSNNTIDVSLNTAFFYPDPILVLESAGALNVVDLGASCALGGPLSPIGSPITIGLFYDASVGSLNVECQDVIVKTILGSSGGLANMPIIPLALTAQSNTLAFTMLDYGGFAMIKGSLR